MAMMRDASRHSLKAMKKIGTEKSCLAIVSG